MEIIDKKDSFLSSLFMFSFMAIYFLLREKIGLILLLDLNDKFYLHAFIGIISLFIGFIFLKISIQEKNLHYRDGFCFVFYKNKFCFISNLIYSIFVGIGMAAIIYAIVLL